MVATSYANYTRSSLTDWDYDYGNNYVSSWDCNTANTISYKYYTTTDAVYATAVVTTDAINTCRYTTGLAPTIYQLNDEYVILPSTYPYAVRCFSKEELLEVKRNQLRSKLTIWVKSRNDDVFRYPGETEPERKALETLREIVSEAEFRKYLRYGFVLVKGQSGRTYQIFKNRSHCKVWLGGKLIEEVCVRIKNKEVPLTDNVIAFKTMIEASEEEFKKLGNVYKMAV